MHFIDESLPPPHAFTHSRSSRRAGGQLQRNLMSHLFVCPYKLARFAEHTLFSFIVLLPRFLFLSPNGLVKQLQCPLSSFAKTVSDPCFHSLVQDYRPRTHALGIAYFNSKFRSCNFIFSRHVTSSRLSRHADPNLLFFELCFILRLICNLFTGHLLV